MFWWLILDSELLLNIVTYKWVVFKNTNLWISFHHLNFKYCMSARWIFFSYIGIFECTGFKLIGAFMLGLDKYLGYKFTEEPIIYPKCTFYYHTNTAVHFQLGHDQSWLKNSQKTFSIIWKKLKSFLFFWKPVEQFLV